MNKMSALWGRVLGLCKRIAFMGPLLVQICLGALFAQSGPRHPHRCVIAFETNYLVPLLWLVVAGPGEACVDGCLAGS